MTTLLLIAALWLSLAAGFGLALGWAISTNRRTELDRYHDERDALARATRTDDHYYHQENRP